MCVQTNKLPFTGGGLFNGILKGDDNENLHKMWSGIGFKRVLCTS